VYENAMMLELKRDGIPAIAQSPIKVTYEQTIIGEYYADIFIDGKVIAEIKAAKSLTEDHAAQLLNYLKATDIEVGLLLNFGPKPKIKRKVFDNAIKNQCESA
jgi:GxxExxY protein